jgi:hypothetical protein
MLSQIPPGDGLTRRIALSNVSAMASDAATPHRARCSRSTTACPAASARPAQNAQTNGRPVKSGPRLSHVDLLGRQRAMIHEERRIPSAARHRTWRAWPQIRRVRHVDGRDLESPRAQHARASTTEVRELVSSSQRADVRIGRRVNSATDATSPSEAIATPGTTRSPGRSG